MEEQKRAVCCPAGLKQPELLFKLLHPFFLQGSPVGILPLTKGLPLYRKSMWPSCSSFVFLSCNRHRFRKLFLNIRKNSRASIVTNKIAAC